MAKEDNNMQVNYVSKYRGTQRMVKEDNKMQVNYVSKL